MLVNKFGFVRVDLDEVKFNLFGKEISDEEIDQPGWDKVYQQMYQIIEEPLKKGKTVVHDTGNFTNNERKLISDIGKRLKIATITIFVDTSKKTAKQRWLDNKLTHNRVDISEQSFEAAVAEMEPPKPEKNVIILSEGMDLNDWIKKHITYLDSPTTLKEHRITLQSEIKNLWNSYSQTRNKSEKHKIMYRIIQIRKQLTSFTTKVT